MRRYVIIIGDISQVEGFQIMNKTLGLDLGSNSLGWAILDNITGDILDKGVVVFPEGIDAANDTLETPAAIRRAARMARRMKFRRKIRKWQLLKVLIENGMCPLTQAELETWKKTGDYPLANKAFLDWLKATDSTNPYCDRAAAAEGKVPPFTLGRALYHIAQRRGFKSSRKDAANIDEESGEDKTQNKKLGAVKADITRLSEEIAASGTKTLGQYFFRRLEAEKGKLAKTRIRCRYTGRLEHYEKEFSIIMDAQGLAGGNPLRSQLYKSIFMQRPLRSQKHLVGACPLEPANPRAQIGHPAFEEYRMLAFVNNLSFVDANGARHSLTAADRDLACTAFMKASPNFKFGDITKLFKKDTRFKVQGYRFHYYHDDETISACQTTHKLRSAFGEVPFDMQKVFDALTFFDDDEKLRAWVRKHYPTLDDRAVTRVAAIHPKDGNAQYSLKAINRILPFLRKGYELSEARFYAKLPDIIPDYAAHEEEILDTLKAIIFEYRQEKAALADEKFRRDHKVTPLFDRYRAYLLERWNIDDRKWNRLYLRGDAVYQASTSGRLPKVELGMIRNPLVQRSMTTLRRLVNYLHDHGKIDSETTIRIELARNVNDFATRKAWQEWQKTHQKVRDTARQELEKLGVKITEDALDRYALWEEQGHICLYTGRSIGLEELVRGNAFDIEHTLPRSLSGDDSLANKTICEAVYNRQVKQGRVPRDCPNWDEIDVRLRGWRANLERLEKDVRSQMRSAKNAIDPETRSRARIKALTTRFERDYWRDKLRRFDITADKLQVKTGELGGFKRRQLVDTGIMSSHAVELLRSVYPATFAVNGTATAFARKAWGVQGDEAKDRTDHTHHAKDAMVIAALTPARFTAICTALKDDGTDAYRRPCDVCPPPYEGFAEKIRHACGEILVKHVLRQTTLRQSSKQTALVHAHPPKGNPDGKPIKFVKAQGDTVRGALHKETYYGKITLPETGKLVAVQRVELKGKIPDIRKIIKSIIDPSIRSIVENALNELERNGKKDIVPGDILMPSGVPVKKVRVLAPKSFQNPDIISKQSHPSKLEYKNYRYAGAAESSNFRMAVFLRDDVFSYSTETKLQWAKGHKKQDYPTLDRMEGFLGYISPGNMVLACPPEDIDKIKGLPSKEVKNRLYYIRVLPSEKETRGEIQFHREARAKKDIPDSEKSSSINLNVPSALIRISANNMFRNLLFEGIHFRMMLDGSITFIKE